MLEIGTQKLSATKIVVAMPPDAILPAITVYGDDSGDCAAFLRIHGDNVKAVCRDARKMLGLADDDRNEVWSRVDSKGRVALPETPASEITPVITMEAK